MFMSALVVVGPVLLLQFLPPIRSLKTGAPSLACSAMVPDHGYSQQNSSPPYDIFLSDSLYSSNEIITVTIHGHDAFKGFLLEGKRADPNANQQDIIGTFTPIAGTQNACNGQYSNGLTHVDTTLKNNLIIQWTAPNITQGPILFRATIVDSFSVFWTKILSSPVMERTHPNVLLNVTPTYRPPPTIFLPLIRTGGCGQSKGCMGYPRGCNCATCNVFATWRRQGNYVFFELSAATVPQGWVAIGFSTDRWMGDDSVTHCITDEYGNVTVGQSYNYQYQTAQAYNFDPINKGNLPISGNASFGLKNTTASYIEGMTLCTFNRSIFSNNSQVFDLDGDFYILLARGAAVDNGVLVMHTEIPVISDNTINVLTNIAMNIGGAGKYSIIRAHACLMLTAWMLCASVAIIFARYYRHLFITFSTTTVWYKVHWIIMITALVCTTLGFIIIFCGIYDYSQDNLLDLPGYQQAHPPIGVSVMILVLANPIMALFRPEKDSKYRTVFRWCHFAVGTAAHFLGVLNIFFGLFLPKAIPFVHGAVFWLMIAFVALQIATEIVLAVHMWIQKRRTGMMSIKKEDVALENVENSRSSVVSQDTSIYAVNNVVLWFYLPAMVALWLAMIILLGNNWN